MPRPPPPKLALIISGIADALSAGRAIVRRIGERVLGAGTVGTPRRVASRLRRGLVAEHLEMLGRGTDETDAAASQARAKPGVLGEEAVARDESHRRRCCARDGDDRLDVQVRRGPARRRGRADRERLVGLEPMQREAIFVAVDRHGAQARARWRRGSSGWRFPIGWRRAVCASRSEG